MVKEAFARRAVVKSFGIEAVAYELFFLSVKFRTPYDGKKTYGAMVRVDATP